MTNEQLTKRFEQLEAEWDKNPRSAEEIAAYECGIRESQRAARQMDSVGAAFKREVIVKTRAESNRDAQIRVACQVCLDYLSVICPRARDAGTERLTKLVNTYGIGVVVKAVSDVLNEGHDPSVRNVWLILDSRLKQQRRLLLEGKRPLDRALTGNRGEGEANLSDIRRLELTELGKERAIAYRVLAYTGLRL